MSVNIQKAHNRIRVYCSLGHREAKQVYFSPVNDEQLALAKLKDLELTRLYNPRANNRHPFLLPEGYSAGLEKQCPVTVRNINLILQSVRQPNIPKWIELKNYIKYETYPPCFHVHFCANKSGGRDFAFSQTFPMRTSLEIKKQWRAACDCLIEQRPHYEQYKAELYARQPSKKDVLNYLRIKAPIYYGEIPNVAGYTN